MAHVLVVEDDRDISEALHDVLVDEGHGACVAWDGRQALEKIIAAPPDLLVLDVDLPILSGPQVACRMFLKDHGLEKIPVLLVSAAPDLRRIAGEVGTPYWLKKPFPVDALVALVDRALAEKIQPMPTVLPDSCGV